MSVSEEFTEYVLELLAPLGNISTSKMFGGVLLKIRGKQLGVIFEGAVYYDKRGARKRVVSLTASERRRNKGFNMTPLLSGEE